MYCNPSNQWKASIEIINITHLKLLKITGLEDLINLR